MEYKRKALRVYTIGRPLSVMIKLRWSKKKKKRNRREDKREERKSKNLSSVWVEFCRKKGKQSSPLLLPFFLFFSPSLSISKPFPWFLSGIEMTLVFSSASRRNHQ